MKSRIGYIPALDGLRGIAVVAVMLFHLKLRFANGGYLGVDVFFVLSGFLITALLLQEWHDTERIALGPFYARRALRLFPALLGLLLVYLAYCYFQNLPWHPVIYAGTYISNWVMAFQHPGIMKELVHTWSLSVEEQFYLLWPLLLIGLLRLRLNPRALAGIILALVVASAAWRLNLWVHNSTWRGYYRVYMGFDTRADALMIGCLTAVLVRYGLAPRISGRAGQVLSVAWVVLSLVWLVAISNTWWWMPAGGLTVVAAATALFLVVLSSKPPAWLTGVLELPVLVWLGRISYGLYLWHYPFFIITAKMPGPTALTLPLRMGIAVGIAAVSYYVIERPFLKLKDRFRAGPDPAR